MGKLFSFEKKQFGKIPMKFLNESSNLQKKQIDLSGYDANNEFDKGFVFGY